MLRNRVRSNSSDSIDVPMGEIAGRDGQHYRRSSQRRYSMNSSVVSKGGILTIFTTLAFMAMSAGGVYYYLVVQRGEAVGTLNAELESVQDIAVTLQLKIESLESEKKKMEQNLLETQRSLEETNKKYEEVESIEQNLLETQRSLEETNKKYEEVESIEQQHQQKIRQLVEYKKKMHGAVQQLSRQRLLEKWGPGPHRLEIQLAFDPNSNVANEPGGDRIVIEMASEAEMPHTVYWFMEQVDRGLYNGASFHRNAEHIIQGGPVGNFLTPPNTQGLFQKFKDSGFESVLFQEYSPKFPHYKHTLGYAGRPGGPDFYISTINNVQNHGPGGQSSYDEPDEADPCFARVVEGAATVDRLHKSEVSPGGYNRMQHNVAITNIRILPK